MSKVSDALVRKAELASRWTDENGMVVSLSVRAALEAVADDLRADGWDEGRTRGWDESTEQLLTGRPFDRKTAEPNPYRDS